MRIAFVYDGAYPWIKGGVEKRLHEIGKGLVKRGHEVHWYCVGWWLNENRNRDIEVDGINYHAVCGPMEMYVNGRRSIRETLYFGIRTLNGLKGEFDIIDCQEFPYFPCFSARFYSALKSKPMVITWHEVWDDYWYEYLGWKGVFGKIIERMTARLSARNIAVSHKTGRDLQRLGVSDPQIIPNGVDFKGVNRVEPSELKSDVIYAGRLVEHKNVDVLLRAIKILKEDIPDIRCFIIGDGPEKPSLVKMVDDLGLEDNIQFFDFLDSHDKLISLMKSSRVFALPSTREGFGIVVLEANACGLPVVTVNHPDNAACDLINSGNGSVCNLSEKKIAESISMHLNGGNSLRRSCIENGRKYDWERITSMVESFYISIL